MKLEHVKITRPGEVINNAGGTVFLTNHINRLKRFLVLGSDGGTFYVSEKKHTAENAAHVIALIKSNGLKALEVIKEYSLQGLTPKQDTIVFALACCSVFGDDETRSAAHDSVEQICRIPTTLFDYLTACQHLSKGQGKGKGWGRGQRRAIANWYLKKDLFHLVQLVLKYQNRNGWRHADVLRLAHVKPDTPLRGLIFKYITNGLDAFQQEIENVLNSYSGDADEILKFKDAVEFIENVELLKVETNDQIVIQQISRFDLVRENIPTKFLSSKLVWKALLKKMPYTALLRNLAKLATLQVFDKDETLTVGDKLKDQEFIQKSRVHPFSILQANSILSLGHSLKGNQTFNPPKGIINSLDSAFNLAFKNVESSNKRFMVGLDVSGSMSSLILGSAISAAVAGACLCLVLKRTEPFCEIYAFSSSLIRLDITREDTIQSATAKTQGINFGATDCSAPIMHALKTKTLVDVFVVITDNETWFDKVTPAEALKRYRKELNPEAKLVVIAMTATEFSIADPTDPGMLDVVGFDASVFSILQKFACGNI